MSARDVIVRALCCGEKAQHECPHGIHCNPPSMFKDDADAILAALRAAPASVRLALARDLAPEGWVVANEKRLRLLVEADHNCISTVCADRNSAHCECTQVMRALAAAPGAGEAG